MQLHALSFGVAYLNDVTGFSDASIYRDLARARCKLVVMHTMTGAFAANRKTAPGEAMASAMRFFDARVKALTDAGIAPSRLVLDPGMGLFLGDGAVPSLEVLRGVGELRRRYELPVMISVSRKSFLRDLTGRALADRGPATLAAEIYAVMRQGAEYVRTHDPGALLDALRVLERLETAG